MTKCNITPEKFMLIEWYHHQIVIKLNWIFCIFTWIWRGTRHLVVSFYLPHWLTVPLLCLHLATGPRQTSARATCLKSITRFPFSGKNLRFSYRQEKSGNSIRSSLGAGMFQGVIYPKFCFFKNWNFKKWTNIVNWQQIRQL